MNFHRNITKLTVLNLDTVEKIKYILSNILIITLYKINLPWYNINLFS
jgi:hypothetical protein